MKNLTLVMPYFANRQMLAEQQRIWADYEPGQRAKLHVVIVDDCSPKGHELTPDLITVSGFGAVKLFRLTQKIRWNWLACRNLGAKHANTDWILLTDMDHGLPPTTLHYLLTNDLNPRMAYRFQRVDAPRSKWPFDVRNCDYHKVHNDSWLMMKRMFFSKTVNGYDERLSGFYGTSSEFTDRVREAAAAISTIPEPIVRYDKSVIPDASIPCKERPDGYPKHLPWPIPGIPLYDRKGSDKNDIGLLNAKNKRAEIKGWKPLHGLTPWEQIL